jgi:hypothetical protein
MLRCGIQPCRFRVIGSLLFFMLLFCPEFSRAAAPTTDAKLTDIIKKARARSRTLVTRRFALHLAAGYFAAVPMILIPSVLSM